VRVVAEHVTREEVVHVGGHALDFASIVVEAQYVPALLLEVDEARRLWRVGRPATGLG
jgi:hypothetical protein